MEYWYLWLILIVLCVITVFVLSKASAAAKKHNNERDALASKALCAVGENELSLIVEKEFSMYDENNEEVSVDKDEIENLDGEFKAKFQKQQVLNSIKTYIIKNIDMLS